MAGCSKSQVATSDSWPRASLANNFFPTTSRLKQSNLRAIGRTIDLGTAQAVDVGISPAFVDQDGRRDRTNGVEMRSNDRFATLAMPARKLHLQKCIIIDRIFGPFRPGRTEESNKTVRGDVEQRSSRTTMATVTRTLPFRDLSGIARKVDGEAIHDNQNAEARPPLRRLARMRVCPPDLGIVLYAPSTGRRGLLTPGENVHNVVHGWRWSAASRIPLTAGDNGHGDSKFALSTCRVSFEKSMAKTFMTSWLSEEARPPLRRLASSSTASRITVNSTDILQGSVMSTISRFKMRPSQFRIGKTSFSSMERKPTSHFSFAGKTRHQQVPNPPDDDEEDQQQ
ncbi:hypothetical protein C8R45DRAFT_921045 [Mycena sanguinolenta]|nr:hypothetical protein C8R45DRAFT_921045 [Mycena sanguinolenta]